MLVVFVPLLWLNQRILEAALPPALLIPWFVSFSFGFSIYSVCMHAARGQTLGKWLMDVRVIRCDESPLGLRHALVRDSVPIVLTAVWAVGNVPRVLTGEAPQGYASLGGVGSLVSVFDQAWLYLEIITMFFNAKRRALHDLMANSVVVRVDTEFFQ